jgi:hypothetical protein
LVFFRQFYTFFLAPIKIRNRQGCICRSQLRALLCK